jgi:hypothetical protein
LGQDLLLDCIFTSRSLKGPHAKNESFLQAVFIRTHLEKYLFLQAGP